MFSIHKGSRVLGFSKCQCFSHCSRRSTNDLSDASALSAENVSRTQLDFSKSAEVAVLPLLSAGSSRQTLARLSQAGKFVSEHVHSAFLPLKSTMMLLLAMLLFCYSGSCAGTFPHRVGAVSGTLASNGELTLLRDWRHPLGLGILSPV